MSRDKTEIGFLEKWDLPFSNELWPSVSVIIPPDSTGRVKVVVMPEGLGRYPGYLLEFDAAPFVMVYDETCAPRPISEWFEMLKTIPKSSAIIWHDSPLVKQYAGIGAISFLHRIENPTLKHYMISGGDSIVEILAYLEPSVVQFDKPQKILIEYSF